MNEYQRLFMNHLDQNGLKYVCNGDNVVILRFNAENLNTVEVLVGFDADGEGKAGFFSASIGSFPAEKFGKALILCNTMNGRYRWCKFAINEDRTVIVRADAILDKETCGIECEEVTGRLSNIVDDAYPEFMKVRWS